MQFLVNLLLLFNLIQPDINVELVNHSSEILPGKSQVSVFRITNNSSEIITPNLNLNLPNGWKLISKPIDFQVSPNTSKLIIYNYKSPKSTDAGSFTINFKLDYNSYTYTNELKVTVLKYINFQITNFKSPSFVKDEKRFVCSYKIQNLGNSKEELLLNSVKGEIKGNVKLNLEKNGSEIVEVEQLVPENIYRTKRLFNDLQVKISSIDSTLFKKTTVIAYPNKSYKPKPILGYQLNSRLSNLYFENTNLNTNVLQYELQGNGYLDTNKEHFVGLHFRMTDRPDLGLFETYNRATVTYKTENNYLQVGDISLNFSRLLEQFRLGKGFYYKRFLKKIELESFYNTLSYYQLIKNQGGLGFKYLFNDRLNLGTKHIVKNYADGSGLALTSSITSNYESEKSRFTGEYGISSKNSNLSLATFMLYRLSLKKLTINSNVLYSQQGFEGFYYDTSSFNLNANYKLLTRLYLTANSQYQKVNQRLDEFVDQQVIPISNIYNFGFQYYKSKRISHLLRLNYRAYQDRGPLNQFNYQEQTLRYRFNLRRKRFSLLSILNYGINENLQVVTNEATKQTYGGQLTTSYAPVSNLKLGTSLNYFKSNRYNEFVNEYLFYGFHLAYNFKNKFNFNLGFRNEFPLEELYQQNSYLNFLAAYNFLNIHKFSINGRLNNSLFDNDSPDIFIAFNYHLNFELPLVKNKNFGSLKGVISSIKPEANKNIVLNIDRFSIITNKNGEYQFKNIPAGNHYLSIDNTSIEENAVTDIKTPLEVEIIPNKTQIIDFKIVSPAKIEGKIIYEKLNQLQSSKFENEQLPEFIIKLENEKGKFLTLFDPLTGNFIFSQVVPGKYTISIITKNYEDNFDFESSSKEIEVKANEVINVVFNIKDKVRKMRFEKKKLNLISN